jgi:hypothetical protein
MPIAKENRRTTEITETQRKSQKTGAGKKKQTSSKHEDPGFPGSPKS